MLIKPIKLNHANSRMLYYSRRWLVSHQDDYMSNLNSKSCEIWRTVVLHEEERWRNDGYLVLYCADTNEYYCIKKDEAYEARE